MLKTPGRILAILALVTLASCGGGGEPEREGNAGAAPQVAALAAPPEQPQASAADTAFFSWAERTYPTFFQGSATDGVAGIYTYRFYPTSRNYLALANGGVYILGPISAGAIQYVAQRTAFACQITPADCLPALPVPSLIAVPGNLRVTDTTAARTAQVYLTAGTAYHFTLQGAATGEGSLADPVLRLLDPQGAEVAINDDHGSNLDSRIAYTATASATFTLSVSGYRGGTGSFRLSAEVNPLIGNLPLDEDPAFYRWPATSVGTGVRDANGAGFRVRSSDGVVVDAAGVAFAELTVNTSSRSVLLGGQQIGSVGYYRRPPLGRFGVPTFYCTDGSLLEINRTRGVWSHRCGWATGEGARVVGSRNGDGFGQTFDTWSDGANADVVVDAADATFRFESTQGFSGSGSCLYGDATGVRYSNFCRFQGAALVLFGDAVYTISRVRSKTGACVTALLTEDGYAAQVRADSTQVVSVSKGTRRPAVC